MYIVVFCFRFYSQLNILWSMSVEVFFLVSKVCHKLEANKIASYLITNIYRFVGLFSNNNDAALIKNNFHLFMALCNLTFLPWERFSVYNVSRAGQRSCCPSLNSMVLAKSLLELFARLEAYAEWGILCYQLWHHMGQGHWRTRVYVSSFTNHWWRR